MRLFGAPFYDVMIKIVVLLVAFQAITIKQSTFPSFTVLSLVELFAGPEKKTQMVSHNESFEKYSIAI